MDTFVGETEGFHSSEKILETQVLVWEEKFKLRVGREGA